MVKVAIIGAGVIGAAIAYELSRIREFEVHVFDQRVAGDWYTNGTATGAALGVLIAVSSTKQQSPLLDLRLASLQRYETLIPELEALTGVQIPYNRQGILELCFDAAAWSKWQRIAQTRQHQGLTLELLTPNELGQRYPTLAASRSLDPSTFVQGTGLQGAVYSPQDRQVSPIDLTQALIAASRLQGVTFHFQTAVTPKLTGPRPRLSTQTGQSWDMDALVIAAGTGAWRLTQALNAPVEIHPVLGQALHLRCEQPWCPGQPPVIQGQDVHLVPLAPTGLPQNLPQAMPQELWVGATVELPTNGIAPPPQPALLDQVYRQAMALCPSLQTATILRTWVGWRPRPLGRPAPIIEPLAGYRNIWLATGHYRNGILLAPITGLKIRQALAESFLGMTE